MQVACAQCRVAMAGGLSFDVTEVLMSAKHLLSAALVAGLIAGAGAGAALAATHASTASTPPTIQVKSSPWGKILVNGKGGTLYLWAKDSKNKSACSGPCLAVWPLVLVSGKPTAGPGVNAKLLGTIKVKGGNEVTYNGWPLYTYISDVKPGVISGEGNKSFGGPWWLVSPSGTAIMKKP
jgi:predicted lipoprotein with Yx(FWY)xxD motif